MPFFRGFDAGLHPGACADATALRLFYNRSMRVTVASPAESPRTSGGTGTGPAEAGAEVHVVMTEAAQKFIQPLTFASLTGIRC